MQTELSDIESQILTKQSDSRNSAYLKLLVEQENTSIQLTTQQQINSTALIEKTIDKLIVDRYNPACTCLTGLLGISAYKLPEYVTVSTYSDIETKLNNAVAWEDKGLWLDNIDRYKENDPTDPIRIQELEDIYITSANIATKYANGNSSVDRDNKKTLEVFADTLFTDYNNLDNNPYTYYDYDGVLRSDTFTIDASLSGVGHYQDLYVDSGKSTHTKDNILTLSLIHI